MNECPKCNGSGWEVVDLPNGASAARRCDCRPVPKPPDPGRIPLTEATAVASVRAMFQTMGFGPKTTAAEVIVADALMSMCATEEQAKWVVRRACALYRTWDKCGIEGLRQILCSRFRPVDGVVLGFTEAFPDGVPPERLLPEAQTLALPAGKRDTTVSADRQIQAAVQMIGESHRLLPPGKPMPKPAPAPRVAETRAAKNFKPITAADMEAEAQRQRAARRRDEDARTQQMAEAELTGRTASRESM